MSPCTLDDSSPDPVYRPFESIDGADLRRVGWLFRWGAWAVGERLWACEWTHNPLLTSLDLRRHPRGPWLIPVGVLGGFELLRYASLLATARFGGAMTTVAIAQCCTSLLSFVVPFLLVAGMVGQRVWRVRTSGAMDDWRGTLLQPDHAVQAIALPPMALVLAVSWAIELARLAQRLMALLAMGLDTAAFQVVAAVLGVVFSLFYMILLRAGVRSVGALALRAHLVAGSAAEAGGKLARDIAGLLWGFAWRSLPVLLTPLLAMLVENWPLPLLVLLIGLIPPFRYLSFRAVEAIDITVWEAGRWWGHPDRPGAADLPLRPFAS